MEFAFAFALILDFFPALVFAPAFVTAAFDGICIRIPFYSC